MISLVVIIWMLIPFVGQGAEHLLGDAGLLRHAQADDGDLGDVVVVVVAFGPQFARGFFDGLERGGQVVARRR